MSKLENKTVKNPTASDTIKQQRDEITLLKAKLEEQTRIIAEMMRADEIDSECRHPASVRTSFNLPNDWTDLEKLWLAFKVLDADNSLLRNEVNDSRDDIAYNVWQALLQAVIIAPVKTHEDLLIKLEAMDFSLTSHLRDNKGNIKLDCVNWLELEAHAINKQLEAVLQRNYLSDQLERQELLKQKAEARETQAKAMTEADKIELANSLNTVTKYSL